VTTVPPRSVFAAAARRQVEEFHDEWDAPHTFITLHLTEDGQVAPWTFGCILTDIDPGDYTRVMSSLALEELKRDRAHPAYAYLLQVEAWGVIKPEPGASEAERAAFDAAARNRTFHALPGAVENCTAWVADIHGRLWSATKTRKDPQTICEHFYRPGKAPEGPLIAGLLAVAQATGVMCHGLMPGTPDVPSLN
jgi:hypothetical protein